MTFPLLRRLAAEWWVLLLRGIAAVAFGVMALAWPGLTLATLVMVFGVYVLVDGVAAVAAGVRDRHAWLGIHGGVAILVGLGAFLWPGLTALAALWLVAAFAVAAGVLQVVAAIRLRREIPNEGWLILGGLASVAFGLVLFAWPAAGAVSLAWLIGAYAIAFGLLLVVASVRLKGLPARLDALASAAAPRG